ncbi:unnamed protein product, partial [Mycena citricolor]
QPLKSPLAEVDATANMAAPSPNIKWAVATVSLGKHASHTLDRKLAAAAKFGFQGIELVYADLMGYAAQNQLPPLQAAEQIGALCKQLGLQILSLNPLKNFEGNLTVPLTERLAQAAEWVDLAAAAGAHSVQVPSQFAPHSTGDFAVIVPELRALADLAAARGVGVAYEAVAFAAHHATWQDSLRIATAVGRAGFGLCLD